MFYILIFILGAVIGSFLNVVILRLQNGEKISGSRSHCPQCGHQLAANDLWPILSFMLLRGKCRYCQKKISWQYLLVELATAILFFIITYSYIGGLGARVLFVSFPIFFHWLRNIIFVCILIVIFVYDFKWSLILDRVTIPAMVFALLANWYLGMGVISLIAAGLVGLAFFAVQYFVSKGKWLGGGDLRLGLLMGLMLGWPKIILAILLSYIIGAVFSLALIALGKKSMKSAIPLGTFLSVGTIITMLWGASIISWYLNLLG